MAPQREDLFRSASKATQAGWIRSCAQVGVVLAVVLVCAYYVGLLDAARMSAGVGDIVGLLGEAWPPDFTNLHSWWGPLRDSLAMSVAATALAVLLAIPVALLGARNTSPHPAVYWVARMVLNTLRSVPELIMAIVFVAAVGFGALPGALALGIHSAGMVGKFFAEAIEHAHPAPIEAAEASGATSLQVISHGVMPQVFPQFADVTMYRWEYNFRASTVMGMVGAGGIGTELVGSLRLLDYPQVSAVLIVILATVTIVDALSNMLRKRFQ
ncbi:phosphonate ABC transporter, permease protein PhnE [Mycolicibacterium poriferae]|uniref:phosphonate ABC transporter, permease protein PhnE n=1 Tax=Mycolicibacterium poriferae TaxID=39694 RepID=UPI003D2EB387